MSGCFCLTRKTPVSGTIQLPFPAANLQEGSLGSSPSPVAPSCCSPHVVFVVGDPPDSVHPPGCFRSDRSQLPLAVLIMSPERCIELVFPLSSRVLQHLRWIRKLSFPMTNTYCFLPASTASTARSPCAPGQASEQLIGQAMLQSLLQAARWKRCLIWPLAEADPPRLKGMGVCCLLHVTIPAALFLIRHGPCFSVLTTVASRRQQWLQCDFLPCAQVLRPFHCSTPQPFWFSLVCKFIKPKRGRRHLLHKERESCMQLWFANQPLEDTDVGMQIKWQGAGL